VVTNVRQLKVIRETYNRLVRESEAIIWEEAQELLRVHRKHLSLFITAMGSACFYDKFGDPISTMDDWHSAAPKKVLAKLRTFEQRYIEPFEEMFGSTYGPMRITAEKRETDW
jgi:hypothetical protein